MATIRLGELSPGQTGVITGVSGEDRFSSRLMELGFTPGATVAVLRKAPLGDPVQYRIRGAVISMRAVDAQRVSVAAVIPQAVVSTVGADARNACPVPAHILTGTPAFDVQIRAS